jgi:paraquat-inducible protein A
MLIADAPGARSAEDAEAWRTPSRLCECASCGQFQILPSLLPGHSAGCLRCSARLRRAVADPLGRALALNIAALSIFAIACLMSLMTVPARSTWAGTGCGS